VRYPRNSEDFSIQTRAAARANPGVLAMIAPTADARKYIQTFKELAFSARIIWGHSAAFRDASFAEGLKDDAVGVLTRADFLPALFSSIPLAGKISTLYRKKTGKDMDGVAARAFTGFQAFLHVLDKAGSTDGGAIQSAANGLEVPASELILPWRGIRFGGEQQNENGQNILGAGVVAQWQPARETGVPELEIVYPPQFATADPIYPFPGWE
jgi:branched-chain amino acid transport system substrate-binding protein